MCPALPCLAVMVVCRRASGSLLLCTRVLPLRACTEKDLLPSWLLPQGLGFGGLEGQTLNPSNPFRGRPFERCHPCQGQVHERS